MMNEQDFIAQADRFLNGELQGAERIAFERYCEENPLAAEQLATHRLFLQQLKQHADRAAFKSTLASVAERYRRPATVVAMRRREPVLAALWNRFKINSLVAAS